MHTHLKRYSSVFETIDIYEIQVKSKLSNELYIMISDKLEISEILEVSDTIKIY